MGRKPSPILSLCLLGGFAICLGCLWFLAGRGETRRASLSAITSSPDTHGKSTVTVAGPAQTQLGQKSEEISRTDAAFEKTLQDFKSAHREERRDARFWKAFAAKYADKNLNAPKNLDDAAFGVGSWMAELARQKAKWGGKIPLGGTPEAEEYQKDQEKLMTGMAAWGKFMTDPDALTPLAEPDNPARFQTLSLAGALNLSEEQMEQIDTALSGYLQNAQTRGLNVRTPPQTGAADWNQARTEIGRQAFNDVNVRLSPEQSAVFRNLYAENAWLWTLVVGE